MATLADNIISNGIKELPFPGVFRPDVLHEIKKMFVSSLEEAMIINDDNVVKYWTEYVFDKVRDIEIPNVAPVFPLTFFQANVPNNPDAKKAWSAIRSMGVMIRVLADKEAIEDPEEYKELRNGLLEFSDIDEEIFDRMRWVCRADVVIDIEPKGLCLLPFSMIYYVEPYGKQLEFHDGKVCSIESEIVRWHEGKEYRLDPEESMENYKESITYEILIPMVTISQFALSLMHCKNVVLQDYEPPEKLSKKHAKHYGSPLVRYKVLQIEPMKQVLEQEGHINETGIKNALHICRGHFKDYTDRGLFGKYHDMYWWEAMVRGKKSKGVVVKDYDIKAPVEMPEQEELDLGIEPYDADVVVERGKSTSEVTTRSGQDVLREKLILAYDGCCAITGCSELSAIQTAHIRPVTDGGPDDIRNAILLESDVHDLWDAGKIYVEPNKHVIRVHPDVEWPDYRKLDGQKIRLPRDEKNWPDPKELEYHRALCDF